jgi:hypothetical protein
MTHRFVIMRNGSLETYTEFEAIPQDFDHVIEFRPKIPPGPHTDQQHEEIDGWNDRLQQLMRIEHARSSQKR